MKRALARLLMDGVDPVLHFLLVDRPYPEPLWFLNGWGHRRCTAICVFHHRHRPEEWTTA